MDFRRLLVLLSVLFLALVNLCCASAPVRTSETDPVLVTVDGQPAVRRSELVAIFMRLPPFMRRRAATDEKKKELLEALINNELFYREALARGLDRTPEFANQIEQIRLHILDNVLAQHIAEQPIEVTEPEIQGYYRDHQSDLVSPETITVKRILISVSDEASEEDVAAALQRAEEARTKLLRGAAWSQICAEYSQDEETRDRDGLLPSFVRGEHGGEFDEVAFGLHDAGQISAVVRDDDGFAILQLVSHEPSRPLTLDEARDDIVAEIRQAKKAVRYEQFAKQLLEAAHVKIHADRLADFPTMADGDVLAEGDGLRVTVGTLRRLTSGVSPDTARRILNRKVLENLLNSVVRQLLFAREAVRRGYDRDPTFLAQMASIRRNILISLVKKQAPERTAEFLAGLRRKHKVVIDEAALQAMDVEAPSHDNQHP